LKEVFQMWHEKASRFLRQGQIRDDYWLEFLAAYKAARIPLGTGVISQAWRLANERPPPPEAIALFASDPPRLAVGVCRELQAIAGPNPFYLSCRTLARLLGHPTHANAARWLQGFCGAGILEEIKKGSGGRASRYRYLLPFGNEGD